MSESSAWKEVKTKMFARIKEIEKSVPGYDYSEKHHVIFTDDRIKDVILDELRKSKKILFWIVETAYEQQKEGLVKEAHSLRDDIDIFLDHVKIKHHSSAWPETIPQEFLQKIVMHDSEILREIPKLNSLLDEIKKMALVIERPGASLFDREQLDLLNRKLLEAKKRADDLMRLFKEREALFELKKLHKERILEDLRSEFDARF